jgi:NAD(P)H dehydrogenase (quinone)
MVPGDPALRSIIMRIALTAATGQLGQLVLDHLVDLGIDPTDVVAVVRDRSKAAGIADRGFEVRVADYEDTDALTAALDGIERLLLISSNDMTGRRVAHHQNVYAAAAAAGVGHVIYTGVVGGDGKATFPLAAEHVESDRLLRESGLTWTALRNGWYVENYFGAIAPAVEHGVVLGATNHATISVATRDDLARAAAVVLTTDGHDNRAYELGADTPMTMADLAAWIADESGRPVDYRDVPEAAYRDALVETGMPTAFAEVLASADAGIARGELDTPRGDLSRLIGRPTQSPEQVVRSAVRAAVPA